MRAIGISRTGDLSVLEQRSLPVPVPQADEVLLKCEWAGVNFIDTYQRSGLYALPLPLTLGQESAGRVVALGEGEASDGTLKLGDKVAAYVGGSFAEYVVAPRSKVVKLPEGLETRDAATALLQGLTGEFGYLCPPRRMASYLGATVIGTVSTAAKASLAQAAGATHLINYADASVSVADEVARLTHGAGVAAIFDGVGKDTWEDDFKMIARKGTIVTFGNASGAVPAFAPLKLAAKNVKVCRPTLGNYVYTREETERYAAELFALLAQHKLTLRVHQEYAFSVEGVRQAQEDIAGRGTTGKLIVKVA
ncbi:GroES-like protein [Tilletiopsis washingtonensis]|uniref:GroES-like protein n=1 Tax=Tilletiopsis washingtonensis TaxID=58919 RepID=A0A316ZBR1_9BASI|nr:GroES-like protein [Tilletiopsis washingtonensis]PWN98991.1 GroES-like protein [Tilletiopsis washingtonensis]